MSESIPNRSNSLRTSAKDIHEAIGAAKHRLNVSQYLGSAEQPGILNQLFEFVDNAVDEIVETQSRLRQLVKEKYGEEYLSQIPVGHLVIKISTSNEVEIMDTGRGLPCDIHPSSGEATAYKIFESDSAGGKGNHSQGGYTSGTSGQHGAGAAVAKSCTEYCNVITVTEGETVEGTGTFLLGYTNGERTSPLQKTYDELALSESPLLAQLGIHRTGTVIRYKYDGTLFKCKRDGLDVEAYDKAQILDRIKPMLLGLDDRNALRITLAFKDEQPEVIDPNEYTPELYLQATDKVLLADLKSKKSPEDRAFFKARVYVAPVANSLSFSSTTVVNRLLLAQSGTNRIVEDKLKDSLRKQIENEYVMGDYFSTEDREIISGNRLLGEVINTLMLHFRALVVMDLKTAEFSGQTKSHLVTTDYVAEFTRQFNTFLSGIDGSTFVRQYVDAGITMIKSKLKYKKQEKKDMQRSENAKMSSSKLRLEADRLNSDPVEALNRKIDMVSGENNTRFTLKASSFSPEKSYLCLVEGASAALALGDIIDLPLTVIGMLGKTANVMSGEDYDPRQLQLLSIELRKPYKGLFLLTDADSDALHIRTLLIAIVWEQATHYITQGRMFIINSPHARITNNNQTPVTVNLKGVAITYPPLVSSLTKSPTETELALLQDGMSLNEKYGGLADCLTDGEGDIELLDLVQDPNYRSVIDAPTVKEIEHLTQMLTKSSEIKSRFTAKLCTDKMNYAKRVYDMSGMKIPKLDLYSQVYQAQPIMEGHELFFIRV